MTPDATPDALNAYFVGVGPRVAAEVADLGAPPDLPCRLTRVGACALTLSPLSLSQLRAIVFGMKLLVRQWRGRNMHACRPSQF